MCGCGLDEEKVILKTETSYMYLYFGEFCGQGRSNHDMVHWLFRDSYIIYCILLYDNEMGNNNNSQM